MIIADLEHRKPLTRQVILGGAMQSSKSDGMRSEEFSPGGSSRIGLATSSVGASAIGSIDANTQVQVFADTQVGMNGVVSSSGSSTAAIAISLP